MGASDEVTDDLYTFFLYAWHLIDWASNDPTIGRTYNQVTADVPLACAQRSQEAYAISEARV